MARRKTIPAPMKRASTDRFRAPGMVVERRTNAWAAMVGFLTGRGYTSAEIERILRDGTSGETVRRMWKLWALPLTETGGRRKISVPIELSARERGLLADRARRRGITPPEYLRRIATCALIDDLYDAVTDGKFDR
ncbi:hypothetical protein [Mesorhizobium sp.]|uniref:hypothetical protein n=1 Tax=Mesorhizobium sp. TaxID=1871066 RepID=UPI0012238D60|nr:hypothetical protein [Mesorhizobium sp.]TIS37531.1 MAG: hypothetical protein E5W95_18130 [Mesorhizobium sp.]